MRYRTENYYHVSSIQTDVYTPVPGVSNLVEKSSYSESACCCVQCEIPFSWWQSIWRRAGYVRMVRTLDTTEDGGRCVWDSEARVRNRAPSREAIRSLLEFTLLVVHGDMFLCLLHKNDIYQCAICMYSDWDGERGERERQTHRQTHAHR